MERGSCMEESQLGAGIAHSLLGMDTEIIPGWDNEKCEYKSSFHKYHLFIESR